MTATPRRTRTERVRAELRARRHDPGPLTDASPATVARLALLQAIDHAVVVAMLELFATPDPETWPVRRRVSILREVQDAFVGDAKDGTTAATDGLWFRLHPDPQRTTTMHPEESEEA